MVREIRVPSSSSSSSDELESVSVPIYAFAHDWGLGPPTNCDGLDLHALLDVRRRWVVRFLVLEDFLAAKRVYKGCPS